MARKMKKKPRSMFRRPLSGELAARLYTMPPLPPTTTTLAAFKSLLLDRLQLLRVAGKFHVDNVLRVPQELQQELSRSAISLAAGSTSRPSAPPPRSSTSDQPLPAKRKRYRSYAEKMYSFSYPQIIRSEWHAQHWMRVIRNTHDYEMLRSRFLALFLWPALLSSVRVDDAGQSSTSVASLLGSGRLTVKSDDDETKLDTTFASAAASHRPQYRSVNQL